MKFFAIAAIMATVSAVKISTLNKGAYPWEQFLKEMDADGSGTVSWPELMSFFKKVAAEHNYTITKEDIKQTKGFFDAVDQDGDGEIDKKEFEAAMVTNGALGQKTRKMFSQIMSKARGSMNWDDVLEQIDADHNGMVSFTELIAWISDMALEKYDYVLTEDDKAWIKKEFDEIDLDGSGEVDEAEFNAHVQAECGSGSGSGSGLAQKMKILSQSKSKGGMNWDDVLEQIDADHNGMVSFTELIGWMTEIALEKYDYVLTEDDKAWVKKQFDQVDTDGSGEVDEAEFNAYFKNGTHGLAQKMKILSQLRSKAKQGALSWEDFLAVLDSDASGTVSWDEIVEFIKMAEKEHGVKISKEDKKAIKAAFEQVDADGSGDIDKAEFETVVVAMEGLAQLKKYMKM